MGKKEKEKIPREKKCKCEFYRDHKCFMGKRRKEGEELCSWYKKLPYSGCGGV